MKTFLSLILALATSSALAVEASFTIPTGAVNITNLVNGPLLVTDLTIVNNGNAATAFQFIDSPQTNTTVGPAQGNTLSHWSNGAYISFSSYLTNITRNVTNFSGLVTNEVRSGTYTYPVTNAGRTNLFRVVLAGTLPISGNTLDLSPSEGSGIRFSRGLTYTNAGTATSVVINVTYYPSL